MFTFFWVMCLVTSQQRVAFNFHRDRCTDWVRAHQQPIRGPGHVVQIDESVESVVAIPKRARGQRVRPFPLRWVFGGTDTTSHEAILMEVPRRDAAANNSATNSTGTTVWSDQCGRHTVK